MGWRDAIESRKHRWAPFTAACAVALAVCVVLMTWLLRLDQAHLEIPFGSGGDVWLNSVLIKTLADTGWVWRNPFLGAPSGTQFFDYPFYDNLDLAIMKLIAVFTSNYATILNLFFLLTFPLTVVSSLLVLRSFKISYASAITTSLLFAFMPYHFRRDEAHLFLSSYFLIPPVTMVTLWVWLGVLSGREEEPRKFSLTRRQLMSAAIICALIGSAVSYYTFFGCYLLCVAALVSAIRFKAPIRLAWGLGLAAFTLAALILNTSPGWMYAWRHGSNPEVAKRSPLESEIYGLKLTHLLFPIDTHRVDFMRNITREYEHTIPTYEGATASLGTVGDVGFIFLLGVVFCSPRKSPEDELINALALLTLASVLLGTMGGLGVIFNYLINPQMRAYNRISIYIAFFSLFGVAWLLDALRGRMGDGTSARYLWYGLSALILGLGILDQTSPSYVPDYAGLKSRYEQQQKFVSQVESTVPPGSMIFELPNERFPEVKTIGAMGPYDELRGYLHSRTLRWSSGAMRGRPEARWAEYHGLGVGAEQSAEITHGAPRVTLQLPSDAIEVLASAGFSGIYIDRRGFWDRGASIIAQLRSLLSENPLESEDQQLAFFNLESFTRGLRTKYTSEEWEARRQEALAVPPANSWVR